MIREVELRENRQENGQKDQKDFDPIEHKPEDKDDPEQKRKGHPAP